VIPDFAALFAFCDLHASRARGWQFDLRYFDRQGFPIPRDGDVEPALVWARLRAANPAYVTVAKDEVPDGSRLSTVWLGLDHGWGGPPLFFETMRFSAMGEVLEFPDPETDESTTELRYGSEEEAAAAHHEILRRLRVRLGH
jgi:hypothetical protein